MEPKQIFRVEHFYLKTLSIPNLQSLGYLPKELDTRLPTSACAKRPAMLMFACSVCEYIYAEHRANGAVRFGTGWVVLRSVAALQSAWPRTTRSLKACLFSDVFRVSIASWFIT